MTLKTTFTIQFDTRCEEPEGIIPDVSIRRAATTCQQPMLVRAPRYSLHRRRVVGETTQRLGNGASTAITAAVGCIPYKQLVVVAS